MTLDVPAWLAVGVLVDDLDRGCSGMVAAIGDLFDRNEAPPKTAFLLPVGGGLGWEAEIARLRPAAPGGAR
ncbi:hypothetical protein [Streptomyces sp. NPDC050485]|uniref:hypothetical protein n=1 Tax=Streptomyces sp. NPDC050485 TaxID=3365617 RepID=UPI0037BB23DE